MVSLVAVATIVRCGPCVPYGYECGFLVLRGPHRPPGTRESRPARRLWRHPDRDEPHSAGSTIRQVDRRDRSRPRTHQRLTHGRGGRDGVWGQCLMGAAQPVAACQAGLEVLDRHRRPDYGRAAPRAARRRRRRRGRSCPRAQPGALRAPSAPRVHRGTRRCSSPHRMAAPRAAAARRGCASAGGVARARFAARPGRRRS